MKKIVFGSIIAFFVVAGQAMAGPFLVSDPVANCSPAEGCRFEVLEAGAMVAQAPAQTDGSMRVDLQGISAGAHNVTARAVNMWGAGAESVPFQFTSSAPGSISGIELKE